MVARKRIPQFRDRAQRKRARAGIGPLQLARVAPKTLVRYRDAVNEFLSFMWWCHGSDTARIDELDAILVKYIE